MKRDDEVPLLERSEEISERRRQRPPQPLQKKIATLTYKIKNHESLDSIALRFACQKEEIKRLNGLFTDADIYSKRELIIPDRRLTAVPTDMLIHIDDQIPDSEESSSIGDAEAAANALFDRIDKSNEEAVHKVSSIGTHPPTEDELRNMSESRLNEFLGNMPPVAVLPKFALRKNETTEWCYLGLCGVITVICVPAFLYYYLVVLQKHITLDP